MKDFIIKDVSQLEYQELSINGKLLNNVLYIIYYDKRICLLCQKEYKRSKADENPNFCPSCLAILTHQHEDKGE